MVIFNSYVKLLEGTRFLAMVIISIINLSLPMSLPSPVDDAAPGKRQFEEDATVNHHIYQDAQHLG